MKSLFSLLFALSFSLQSSHAQVYSASVTKLADLPIEVAESSGIVCAGLDKIWTHSDSGEDNELFLVDTAGNLLRTLVIGNATNVDWEDLARDDQNRIWINDAGNNGNGRRDLRLYRIADPNANNFDTLQADILNFSFSDQNLFPPPASQHNFDIEAICWYADSIFLFTKDRSSPFTGFTKMYSLPATAGSYVAQLRDSLFIDSDIQRGRVTAADIDTATGNLALLTRAQVMYFYDFPGTSFFQGQSRSYFFVGRVDQVEALAFVNSNTLYMTDEGSPANNVRGGLYQVSLNVPANVEEGKDRALKVFTSMDGAAFEIQTKSEMQWSGRLYDVHGREIRRLQGTGSQTISMLELPAGMYIIRLSTPTGRHFHKVLRQ
jgi:hypothetical protein